ncbi:hypothetical protein ACFUTV_23140 [Streptomyces sp. NPDC057298]|uniref:hypothetical protein n=1 Tax=Streptomyces sp. NPDC057298 TaxID=3346091 RepID=UPI0036288305
MLATRFRFPQAAQQTEQLPTSAPPGFVRVPKNTKVTARELSEYDLSGETTPTPAGLT